MSATVSENVIYSSSPLMNSEKQGIVTILRSEQVNSFRRTLSADMSSEKWLAQHGLSPAMKKIASSEEISISVPNSSSSSEGGGDSDVFGFFREENRRKETEKKHLPIDIWSSILSDRAGEEASKCLPPPYVHPLVKRSASSLSENSLKICTESLGSETGSDGFSSYPSSEIGDDGKDEEESEEEKENWSQRVKMEEVIRPVKFNKTKSPSRSFPPPLPWLSDSSGASVRVQSRREKGRLTVEAVLSPSRSNFLARRQDGRLVLSFADYEELDADLGEEREEEIKEQLVGLEDQEKENEQYSETVEEDDEEAAVEDENDLRRKTTQMEFVMKNAVISVHRLALMVKRPSGLANYKFNEEIKSGAEEEGGAKSPLKPRLSLPLSTTSIEAPSSLNAHESYWRIKALALTKPIRQENPSSAMNNNSSTKRIFSKNLTENEQKNQITGLRGNKRDDDNSVSFSKLCKEPRKSLLFWEPYCIATSS